MGEWDVSQEIDCDHSIVNEKICAPKPIDFKVSQMIAHENYAKGVDDIGLIRLENQVTFNEFIRPVCLSSENKSFIGKQLIVVGFGRTEHSGTSNSDIKLKVGIKAVPNEICEKSFRIKISSKQICAGGQKNKDSCKG